MPRGDTVVLRQTNGSELPLAPRALIASRPEPAQGAPDVPVTQTYRFSAFRADGNALVSELRAENIEVRLRLSFEAGTGFTMNIVARPLSATWIRLLSLEIDLDVEGAQLLGRDLRLLNLENVAVLGRLDPKWLTLFRKGKPLVTLVADDQIDGLQIRRQQRGLRLRVDLLAVEARPFFHFANCTTYWKDPNQRLILPARLFLPGEETRGQVSLYSGGPVPLLKARYPEGRRAALVITDHADQTAAPTLRTLAGGTSDATDPKWGQGGLLGRGIAITKALWYKSGDRDPTLRQESKEPATKGTVLPQGASESALPTEQREPELELMEQLGLGQADENGGGRPQLDDPQVVALADRLHAAGWEIIPHSATPLRDSRELTQKALNYFRRYRSRTWIDHQPYTNCEALVNQGYRPGPYGISDLLQQHGYVYAWAGLDAAPGDLNLLMPRRLDRYAPVLWPAGRLAPGTPSGFWLFRSMLAFIETQRFFDIYNGDALDRLERERGLHISHTYLEDFHPPKTWFGKRNLLSAGERPREIVLDPRLDGLLSEMAARIARGTLWAPTVARLGDHVRAMADVRITLEADGTATLYTEQGIQNATFVVPRPGMLFRVDGQPPKGQRYAEGETSFWVDLLPRRPMRVSLRTAQGESVSFLSAMK